ncbi:MAG: radical SAM protein [Nanoarchaeota archaeon]
MKYIINKDITALALLITQRCNLDCDYCYIEKNPNSEMKLDIAKKVIDFFLNSQGKYKKIILLGGEPLLREKFISEILDYVEKQKINFSEKNIITIINTNGTIYTKTTEDLISKIDYISVSIDGIEESHNMHRKFKNEGNSFVYIHKNIKKIAKKYPKKIIINKVITPRNYIYLKEDIEFILKEYNPLSLNLNVALAQSGWNKENIIRFITITKYIFKNIILKNKYKKKFEGLFSDYYTSCAISSLACDKEGNLYVCEILARLKKDSIGNYKNIKPNLITCEFNPKSMKCHSKFCHECNQICKKIEFQKGKLFKKLSLEEINFLDKAHQFQGLFNKLQNKEYFEMGDSIRIK